MSLVSRVASLGWAILLLHMTMFRPCLVFANRMPQSYRQNDTIALSVSLPKPGESKKPSRGLMWQDLSVMTPNNECLVRSSSGYLENGKICGILGPCKLSNVPGQTRVQFLCCKV